MNEKINSKKIFLFVNMIKGRERGADNDAKHMLQLFSKILKFEEVHIRNDISLDELYGMVEKLLNNQSTKPEVFVLCISSHGRIDKEGTQVELSNGIQSLNKIIKNVSDYPALVDVPKIFFVNCCRRGSRTKFEKVKTKFDFESDKVFISYSAKPGQYSNRIPDGSYFISLLCEIFEKYYCLKSLQNMLRMVSMKIHKKSGGEQTSEFVGFKKSFYFR
jgi:Caspase domain